MSKAKEKKWRIRETRFLGSKAKLMFLVENRFFPLKFKILFSPANNFNNKVNYSRTSDNG